MPRGPLPADNKRRRNAPTIPTTNLPASGLDAPTPDLPAGADLGVAGSAWWEWAWHTPQAAAWGDGALYAVARRASLEDDLATIRRVESLDAGELADAGPRDWRSVIERLAALATGRLTICREIRELDDRLGLTPKAMAQLRWKITEEGDERQPRTPQRAGRADLKVV